MGAAVVQKVSERWRNILSGKTKTKPCLEKNYIHAHLLAQQMLHLNMQQTQIQIPILNLLWKDHQLLWASITSSVKGITLCLTLFGENACKGLSPAVSGTRWPLNKALVKVLLPPHFDRTLRR